MYSSSIAGLFLAIVFMLIPLWLVMRMLLGRRTMNAIMGKLAYSFVLWIIHRIFGPPKVRVVMDRRKHRHIRH